MIAIPSIAMLLLLAVLSVFGSNILRRPWQRWTALGCAFIEVAAVVIICLALALA
jgi:hypothetical protein